MPTLEIVADDVTCSHGATVSDLDENSMFYLASRGISRSEARQLLLVRGAVPGAKNGHVVVRPAIKVRTKVAAAAPTAAPAKGGK